MAKSGGGIRLQLQHLITTVTLRRPDINTALYFTFTRLIFITSQFIC